MSWRWQLMSQRTERDRVPARACRRAAARWASAGVFFEASRVQFRGKRKGPLPAPFGAFARQLPRGALHGLRDMRVVSPAGAPEALLRTSAPARAMDAPAPAAEMPQGTRERDFIFGYGSIINNVSRSRTCPDFAADAVLARISADFGCAHRLGVHKPSVGRDSATRWPQTGTWEARSDLSFPLPKHTPGSLVPGASARRRASPQSASPSAILARSTASSSRPAHGPGRPSHIPCRGRLSASAPSPSLTARRRCPTPSSPPSTSARPATAASACLSTSSKSSPRGIPVRRPETRVPLSLPRTPAPDPAPPDQGRAYAYLVAPLVAQASRCGPRRWRSPWASPPPPEQPPAAAAAPQTRSSGSTAPASASRPTRTTPSGARPRRRPASRLPRAARPGRLASA